MKRFIFIVTSVIAAFLFFSFLSRTDIKKDKLVYVLYDESIAWDSIIIRDITSKIGDRGYKVETGVFQPNEINSYIISNPDAIYISDNPIESNFYSLTNFDYSLVKVAVTNKNSTIRSISGKEFDNLLISKKTSDTEIWKKIKKGRVPLGIISFENLNLDIKPIPVDDIYPTLYNINSGLYKKVFSANIVVKDNSILNDNPSLLYDLGQWRENTFSIIAGGDIMLTRGANKYIRDFGVDYPFLSIREEIIKHDIAFANLESPVSHRGSIYSPFKKGIYFKADPEVLEGLKFAGFDVFSLANNHVLDWGIDAVSDTMELLDKSGFRYSGVGETREEALKPAVFYMKDTSVAFVSFNDIYPFVINQSGKTMWTLTFKRSEPEIDPEIDLEKEIKELKSKYDIVIASVHSGIEYVPEPESEKVKKMRELIDYGVDVVLGGGPHVIQGIEVYKGGIIAYSLGNFIFDQDWSKETSLGLLLEISFLGEKPVYFNPSVLTIDKAQAKLINNGESEFILTYLNITGGDL
ncbi:MAG TPA: CapA family protein [Spirochaetes bacterium]|nr:CapA family protein [Spirochaetota bacterium]